MPPISLSLADSQNSGKGRGAVPEGSSPGASEECARGQGDRLEKEGASGDAAAHTGLSWKAELETE